MNYFAHALPFLNNAYLAAGSGVPDWLSAADRKVRVRMRHAEEFVDDPDPKIASIARGVRQHILDDSRFHGTRAFAELSLEFTATSRDVLDEDPGLRPSFLGHLLVEMLLDASLIAEEPGRLDQYYRLMDSVDPRLIEETVNRMASRTTEALALMISGFCRARILWDYLEDAKLFVRLNQVMRRVDLGRVPDHFQEILPEFRRKVDARKSELLDGIPVPTADNSTS